MTRVAVQPNEHLLAFLRGQNIDPSRVRRFDIHHEVGCPIEFTVELFAIEEEPSPAGLIADMAKGRVR